MEPYPITSPSTDIVLTRQPDGTMQGTSSFTVTNKTGQVVRARVDAAGQDPAAPVSPPAPPTWFALKGTGQPSGPARSSVDSDFGLDETRQFSVEVNVPGSVSPGVYGARPFVATSDKSDEVFTYGDAWKLTVPAAATPPKRKFPWWILAIGAVVVILIAVTIWRLTSGGKSAAPTPPTTPQATIPSIPPAPIQIAPPDGQVFNYSPSGLLEWSPVPGATSYLLEIQFCSNMVCSDGTPPRDGLAFASVEKVVSTTYKFAYTDSSFGFRWRVSAVVPGHPAGAMSPWHEFH